MTIHDFIKKRPYLIWYVNVKDFDKLDIASIVEAVLNYGDMDDVRKIISILGIKKVAKVFFKQIKNKRCNYYPEIKHYFSLYFKKHA